MLMLVAVSFVTFALVAASPVDPVSANVGQAALMSMSAERRAALAAYWGKDRPLLERYGSWALDVLHGDFGTSLRFNAPVASVVGERLSLSLGLLLLAWLVSGAMGFLLGTMAGARPGCAVDRIVRGYCYLMGATPVFWVGMVVLFVFAVRLHAAPVGLAVPIGSTLSSVSLADRLSHMVLPGLTLALTGVAPVALHTRERMIEVMGSDYVRFARARGESGVRVVLRHVLRNVAAPALMLQGASMGELVGGSVLVEQVFSYPGLGQAAVTAGLGGDAPLLVGIALATAVLVYFGNAVADLLRRRIDPRGGEDVHGMHR